MCMINMAACLHYSCNVRFSFFFSGVSFFMRENVQIGMFSCRKMSDQNFDILGPNEEENLEFLTVPSYKICQASRSCKNYVSTEDFGLNERFWRFLIMRM